MTGTVKKAVEAMLTEQMDFAEVRVSLQELHELYATITGIRAGDITDKSIYLPSGKAVSSICAAHCLLEFQRTATFTRGIYRAVLALRQDFPGEQFRVLYAGCGPYATLVTPLTALFLPARSVFICWISMKFL